MQKGILPYLFTFLLITNASVHAAKFQNDADFMFADVLYWQVREGGADMVGEQISPIGTANPSVKLLDAPFNWNAGFRIGGGHQHSNDWDSVIYYTSYRTQATHQISAPGQLYSPYIGNFFQNNIDGQNNGPFYNAAGVRWTIDYNTLDLELGRTFKIDSVLKLRPFLGLKGAVINQNIYTNWEGPNTLVANVPVPITTFTSATENLSNYFSGIGPSFGLDTTWPIYQFTRGSLNLIGNFSAALLWGLWRYKDNYQTDSSASVNVTGDDIHGAAPMTKAFVGLEWTGAFPKSNITIRLGYEGQVWFDQVQFNTLSSGRLNDLMSLQGGVLDFRVNF